MSIEGKIKTLYSDRDEPQAIFPRTKVNAISDNDGIGLDAILEDVIYSGPATDDSVSVPINADTLGGRPAEEFATQNFVSNEIAKAQLSGDDSEIDLSGFATSDNLNAHANNTNNPHNVTIEQIGAAPAGYGLGLTSGAYVDDCNKATAFGLYSVNYLTVNNPLNAYGALLVLPHNETEKGQILTSSYIKGIVIRHETGGVWGEWEWVNPPMAPDVEYRTTERIGSKTVYKKNVNGVIQYRLEGETEWKNQNGLMGSAPAGYGLGESPIRITNVSQLDSYSENGWYRCKFPEAVGFDDVWCYEANLHVTRTGDANWTQELFIAGQTLPITRTCQPDWRSEWKKASAPAGYGLGETAKFYYPTSEVEMETMLNAILSAMEYGSVGFYYFSDSTGSIWGGGTCAAVIPKTNDEYSTVEFFGYMNLGSRISKTKHDGSWNPLEWENPPMALAVEYRTTERWKGKPVYTALCNLGYAPNAQKADIDIGATATEVLRVCGNFIDASTAETETFPSTNGDKNMSVTGWVWNYILKASIATNYDASTRVVYAQFWYCKE